MKFPLRAVLKMNRQVNLIDYLPRFMREYEEIKRLLNAENSEFQAVFDASESTRNDLFALSCNERGIERFEKLLGIAPAANDALNTRISRVIIRLNDALPITFATLIGRMDAICGQGNYELIPDWDSYFLRIVTHFDIPGQTDELKELIEEIIPANLRLEFKNNVDVYSECTAYFGGAIQYSEEVWVSYSGVIDAEGSPDNTAYLCGTIQCQGIINI